MKNNQIDVALTSKVKNDLSRFTRELKASKKLDKQLEIIGKVKDLSSYFSESQLGKMGGIIYENLFEQLLTINFEDKSWLSEIFSKFLIEYSVINTYDLNKQYTNALKFFKKYHDDLYVATSSELISLVNLISIDIDLKTSSVFFDKQNEIELSEVLNNNLIDRVIYALNIKYPHYRRDDLINKINDRDFDEPIFNDNIINYNYIIERICNHIFYDFPNSASDSEYIFTGKAPSKIIYNNDVYKSHIYDTYTLGKQFKPSNDAPLGYNIHIPSTNPVNGVYVNVYGGTTASKCLNKLKNPNILNDLEKYLVDKGIAVVTLNLLDLKELICHQNKMPELIHNRLHESIHEFYLTLRNFPENLHPSLKCLKGVRIILEGESFGGRTAIKHAELYPDDFDGYISFNGDIEHKMGIASDLKCVGYRNFDEQNQASLWLDPGQGVDKIKKPILISGNLDDNNVNIMVQLSFAQLLKDAGKEDLITTLFNIKGNKIISNKSYNKGHYYPTDTQSLEYIAEGFTKFIMGQSTSNPLVNDLVLSQIKLYAEQNYRSASVEEKFMSEAYSYYKKSEQTTEQLLQEIDDTYTNLYNAIAYASTIEIDNTESEANQLISNDILTDNMIEKAIKASFSFVLEYLTSVKGVILRDTDNKPLKNFNKAENKDMFFEGYKDALINGNPTVQKYILYDIYKTNPEIINNEIFSEFRQPLVAEAARQKFITKMQLEDMQIHAILEEIRTNDLIEQNKDLTIVGEVL